MALLDNTLLILFRPIECCSLKLDGKLSTDLEIIMSDQLSLEILVGDFNSRQSIKTVSCANFEAWIKAMMTNLEYAQHGVLLLKTSAHYTVYNEKVMKIHFEDFGAAYNLHRSPRLETLV